MKAGRILIFMLNGLGLGAGFTYMYMLLVSGFGGYVSERLTLTTMAI